MKSEKINYRRKRIIVTALAPPGNVSEDTAQGKWEVSADLGVGSIPNMKLISDPTFLHFPHFQYASPTSYFYWHGNEVTGAPCKGLKSSQTSLMRCCSNDDLPPEKLFLMCGSCSGSFCAVSLLFRSFWSGLCCCCCCWPPLLFKLLLPILSMILVNSPILLNWQIITRDIF